MDKKKLIYVCSPYQNNPKFNILKAVEYCKIIIKNGGLPLCVHLFLEKATGLNESRNRDALIKLGKEYIKLCDEVWVFGNTISKGMKEEIEFTTKIGKEILYDE